MKVTRAIAKIGTISGFFFPEVAGLLSDSRQSWGRVLVVSYLFALGWLAAASPAVAFHASALSACVCA